MKTSQIIQRECYHHIVITLFLAMLCIFALAILFPTYKRDPFNAVGLSAFALLMGTLATWHGREAKRLQIMANRERIFENK